LYEDSVKQPDLLTQAKAYAIMQALPCNLGKQRERSSIHGEVADRING